MILEVTRELRGPALRDFQARLDGLIERGQVEIVLDFAAFDHADSAGLGTLVNLQQRLEARGGSLAIARPNAAFRRLIRITGIDLILPVYPTVDEACHHFD